MRQSLLLVALVLLMTVVGCGYKTDLTLPDERAEALSIQESQLLS